MRVTLTTVLMGKILLLALLYIITGKLGLFLAVPPGYATVIWPPSGIAIGILLVHGLRLWPGILIGSFVLNCYIGGAYSPDEGLIAAKMLLALGIAIGSTLQALAGWVLVSRFLGLPLKLHKFREIFLLIALTGPVACVIAATVGTAVLFFSGVLATSSIVHNWLTWWAGDLLGIIVFLPLILVAPGAPYRIQWRGSDINAFPMIAMLAILVPLGLTFYAWKIASENVYQSSLVKFTALAQENEKALIHRINSYDYALLGGSGFFQGSDFVSRQEWRTYADAIDIRKNFPGMKGIGWIAAVKQNDLQAYIERVRLDGTADFFVHPQTDDKPYYIITYIEPEADNKAAIGLNIGFEKNRIDAADLARDSGLPTITRHITLVQDTEKTPGFLLLHPLYYAGMPTSTAEQRRLALRGWIYAPFVAQSFLKDLTRSQGDTLNIRIYDEAQELPENLIYASAEANAGKDSAFSIRKKIRVMQRDWLVVWESTPEYMMIEKNESPLFILIGGLLFTGLLGVFFTVVLVRRTETMEWMAGDKKFAVPLTIFLITAIASFYLYDVLSKREQNYVDTIVEEEAKKIEQLITFHMNEKLLAIRRMAQRWEIAGGTPYNEWQSDAKNYVQDLIGLKTVELVDSSYHVRWAEPVRGNETAIGLNILFNKEREEALKGAAEKNTITITPPLDLIQGYKGFIAYAPLRNENNFDGFIVGIFDTHQFLNAILKPEVSGRFALFLDYDGKEFFQSEAMDGQLDFSLQNEKSIKIYDKEWTLKIVPATAFVKGQISLVPIIVLSAGLLIALLLSLTVRYILISRIKSEYLRNSEETFRSAMEDASIGMALVDLSGRWLKVNQALCDLLGYDRETLLQNDFQSITYPDDLSTDLEHVQKILSGKIQTYQMEKRYYHRSGRIIWTLLNVSLIRNQDGTPRYFVSQIQDITHRKEMDRIKSEFISIVSHELRTPLTSVRGALGIIIGTMSKDLPAQANHLIDIAYKSIERLILLINDILDIDKIASGQMRFHVKEEQLSDLIEQAIEANAAYAEKLDVHLVSDAVDPALKLHVDAERFMQVLFNLLSNAIKFSPRNETVRIYTSLKNDVVRVSVEDRGPGIPEEFHARIFGKFSQVDSSATRSKGGTGLGLHISKQIVEQMGGQIGFETKANKGSVFWIDFPLIGSGQNNIQAIAVSNPDNSSKLPKILHVEDDKILSDMLSEALKGKADIVLATSVEQAQSLLDTQAFKLIVLDNELPDGSGLELLSRINEGNIPVIILSSAELPEHIQKCAQAVMIKARVLETDIIDTILKLVKNTENE